MNDNELVEMINTITRGGYYAHSFETTPNSNSISIEVGRSETDIEMGADDEFWFSTFDDAQFLAKINNPRTAREIADALIAWANRREGVGTRLSEDTRFVGELNGQRRVTNSSREDWYRRNVGLMSQETKDRNLKDLVAIWEAGRSTATQPSTMTKEEAQDIAAAMQILRKNGARNTMTKEETKAAFERGEIRFDPNALRGK